MADEGCVCRGDPPPCDGTSSTLWCGCVFNGETLYPSCNGAGTFVAVVFGSMGTPKGECGAYTHGDCMAPPEVVEAAVGRLCLGESECEVPATVAELADGVDPCFGDPKYTALTLQCSEEIPTDFERFRREWGLLSLLVVAFAGVVLYAVGGATLYARPEIQAVPGFGRLGAHPHAANWRELASLVADGFTFAFGGGGGASPSQDDDGIPPDPPAAIDATGTPHGVRSKKSKKAKKKRGGGGSSSSSKKKKRQEAAAAAAAARQEPLLKEHRDGGEHLHSSQQKIKVITI